jgi:hypothetical protein
LYQAGLLADLFSPVIYSACDGWAYMHACKRERENAIASEQYKLDLTPNGANKNYYINFLLRKAATYDFFFLFRIYYVRKIKK